jgi:hypothetical protein
VHREANAQRLALLIGAPIDVLARFDHGDPTGGRRVLAPQIGMRGRGNA